MSSTTGGDSHEGDDPRSGLPGEFLRLAAMLDRPAALTVIEHAATALVLMRGPDDAPHWNLASRRLLGYRGAERPPADILDAIHPADRRVAEAWMEKRRGEPAAAAGPDRVRFMRSDGESVQTLATAISLAPDRGPYPCVIVIRPA